MNVLNRLKIKAKLFIVLGVSAAALMITVAIAASILYRSMFDERIAKLHAIVEMAERRWRRTSRARSPPATSRATRRSPASAPMVHIHVVRQPPATISS